MPETLRVPKPDWHEQRDVPENEDVKSLLQAHEPGVLAHLLEARLPWGNAGTFLSCLPAINFQLKMPR